MKQLFFIILILFCAVPAFSQGATQYPTTLDDSTTLPTAADNKFTSLTAAIDASITSFANVASTSGWPTAGTFWIGNEQIAYTTITSTRFVNLTRGFGNTTASSHAINATISLKISAAHVNGTQGAALAIEAKLGADGTGGTTIPTNSGDVLTVTASGKTTYKPVPTGGVTSFNSRTGAVTLTSIDVTDALTYTPVAANTSITGATKTKITYDSKGLVTAGADATTADIADSTNKRYVTDAQRTVITNTSGTNTGDQTITLTGDVTGSGTGSFATTIGAGKVTNAMLAGSIDLTAKVTSILPIANGGTNASTASGARTSLGLAIGTDVEAHDTDLTAVAGLSSNGLIARTGTGTAAVRTITGTTNRVTCTSCDGVSGNPVLTTPQDTNTTATPTFGKVHVNSATSEAGIELYESTGAVGYSIGRENNSNGHLYFKGNQSGADVFEFFGSGFFVNSGMPFKLTTTGSKIYIKEGTNASMGRVTLSSGAATISTTNVTANSEIFLTLQDCTSNVGTPYVSARIAGTSFTVSNTNSSNACAVSWIIIEPN